MYRKVVCNMIQSKSFVVLAQAKQAAKQSS